MDHKDRNFGTIQFHSRNLYNILWSFSRSSKIPFIESFIKVHNSHVPCYVIWYLIKVCNNYTMDRQWRPRERPPKWVYRGLSRLRGLSRWKTPQTPVNTLRGLSKGSFLGTSSTVHSVCKFCTLEFAYKPLLIKQDECSDSLYLAEEH